MGGTVVRASVGSACRSGTSTISISPRLLGFHKHNTIPSSALVVPQLTIAVPFRPTSSLPRNSHVVSPGCFPYVQQAPVSHVCLPYLQQPYCQQAAVSLSLALFYSSSSPSNSSSSVSLMSSCHSPAISSSFCGTRLEGGLTTGLRRRHAIKIAGPSFAKANLSNCCRVEERGVRITRGAMENKTKGQRIECYSSAQAGDGDQPTSSSSVLPPLPSVSKAKGLKISFCPRCGGATEEKIPVGEHELRFVCTACGAVHYQNPKMVVGCLVEHEEKVLLCRRSIKPSYGLWTLPAGYMEIGESAAEGAARETKEEACADVQILGLFAVLDIPFIGQSYIIFRARLKDAHFAPGPESLECALFKLNEIPFESLAFSSIHVALTLYVQDIEAGKVRVHHGVIDKRPGASPSDLKGFVVRDVLSS